MLFNWHTTATIACAWRFLLLLWFIYDQEMGVPQGAILCVTPMFILKMNSIYHQMFTIQLALESVDDLCVYCIYTLGIKMNQNILDSEINLNSIAINSTPYIPPWVLKPAGFQLSVHSHFHWWVYIRLVRPLRSCSHRISSVGSFYIGYRTTRQLSCRKLAKYNWHYI